MTAALNTLTGQLKLDPKLSAIANQGKKKGDNKDKKKKNKKNTTTCQEEKKDEAFGRKSRQKMVKSMRNMWANTLTTGVSTTWRGWFTSPLTACWANSTRKIKRRSHRRPTLLPLLLPLQRR
jgi:hypothetical protein